LLCQITLQNAKPDDLNKPPVVGKWLLRHAVTLAI
jgi:hypothetical protein